MMDGMKLYKEGQLAAEQRNFEKALELYTRALELITDNADLLHDRGVTYFHLKKMELALEDMDKAVSLEPNHSYRYSARAYIRGFMKDIDGAIADYRIAVELDPEDAVAYNNLGLMEEQAGHKPLAQERFKKADELAVKMGWDSEEVQRQFQRQEEFDREIKEKKELDKSGDGQSKPSVFKQAFKVFTDKKTFREFIRFVGNGFKNE